MIPPDIRLFTWLDVQEVIERALTSTDGPNPSPGCWFVSASAYWNELSLGIHTGNLQDALQWMRDLFDPRIKQSGADAGLNIVLEGLNGTERLLPVVFEEQDPAPNAHPRAIWPTFARAATVEREARTARPSAPLGIPPVAVLHSFKGGVGRTTHAIALALAASARQNVLLADADLEVPGISWLMQERLHEPPVSFADLIALAHGDSSPRHEQTVALVAERLRNALVDGCFILPAFRRLERLPYLDIRPEHLISGHEDPFVLTQLLSDLGRKLGAGLVVVDLRAGYSELAAGLLMDPRVYRIFVTTLSGQAMEGTLEILRLLGRRAPSVDENEPYPAIIVSQIPDSYGWREQFDKLVEARSCFLPPTADVAEDPMILESGFDQTLQVTAADWKRSTGSIGQSAALTSATSALLEWLPAGSIGAVQPDASNTSPKIRREQLRNFAGDRIFAEKKIADEFLETSPLQALARENISQLPICVITGAKGAGKTFTFLQQVRTKSWKAFVQAAIGRQPGIDAPMIPILSSWNLGDDVARLVGSVRRDGSQKLGFGSPMETTDLHDVIRARLDEGLNETRWRDTWLDCIAWSAGVDVGKDGAGRRFADKLDQSGHRLIALFDGLEDLFQGIATNTSQQLALRVLLQEVPQWLSQRPGRTLGLIVYVRRDLVGLAVLQNAQQLIDKYRDFSLLWDWIEALRLANWIRTKALGLGTEQPILAEEALKEKLIPMWGKKLGSDQSRESRTADWILNALSDYNNQIQARDLVRLIAVAAGKSIAEQSMRWTDRELTPQAIRDALPECSRAKIEEIVKENQALKRVFEKLQGVREAERVLPFDASFAGLDLEDIAILENNGAIYNDGGRYYLPEIYLHGLGFTYSSPGRRRVISNRRRKTSV